MIVLRYDLKNVLKATTLGEVFRALGVGDFRPKGWRSIFKKKFKVYLGDTEVFGPKAYYKNMIISESDNKRITDALKATSRDVYLQWCNYSPLSSGPKYNKVKKAIGVSEGCLYIITPVDKDYEKDPTLDLINNKG